MPFAPSVMPFTPSVMPTLGALCDVPFAPSVMPFAPSVMPTLGTRCDALGAHCAGLCPWGRPPLASCCLCAHTHVQEGHCPASSTLQV